LAVAETRRLDGEMRAGKKRRRCCRGDPAEAYQQVDHRLEHNDDDEWRQAAERLAGTLLPLTIILPSRSRGMQAMCASACTWRRRWIMALAIMRNPSL
jgi:hypothetical protein